MSDDPNSAPTVTASARTLLAGRPVSVRASRRNGCCGGSASVPVAEPGAPDAYDEVRTAHFDVAGVHVYVERELLGPNGSWTIDTDGFARWRRLVLLSADRTPR